MIAYLMAEDHETRHGLDAPEGYHQALNCEFRNDALTWF